MEHVEFQALQAKWNAPPPGAPRDRLADAEEGAAFMAFMGAANQLKAETSGR